MSKVKGAEQPNVELNSRKRRDFGHFSKGKGSMGPPLYSRSGTLQIKYLHTKSCMKWMLGCGTCKIQMTTVGEMLRK